MANHLASIYGTEADKVNCSFYFKIGACRHGERCSRKHVHPPYSQTILCPNLYNNESNFDAFYEDLFSEFALYGKIEELVVCENVGDHLIGNVYCRFLLETSAQSAIEGLNARWYNSRPVYAELSPVTDFREACCRQHETGECLRGGLCNFMHKKPVSKQLERELYAAQSKYQKMLKSTSTNNERSISPRR